MATIQWRPQVNALTKPLSYRIQVVPRNIVGYEEMANDISSTHPIYNADLVQSLAPIIMEWIKNRMINGDQVTLEDAFIFRVSALGRLDNPNDPLPDDAHMLQGRISPAREFQNDLRQAAEMERLPMNEKLPLITLVEDTKLKLENVLNPNGILHLTGSNLYFDEHDPDCSCVITGTQSGESKQSTFGVISNAELLFMPDIPAQANPWNNEYTITVTTQYTEHGTPRSGTYRHRLRTPLTVAGMGLPTPPETGILTDKAATAHVSVNGGTVSANTRLRIQVIQDLPEEKLFFSLMDMEEDGESGEEVAVLQNGEYILPGFAGSTVSSLEITVNDYTALWEMIRNGYSGMVVDVLDIQLT